MRHHRTAPQDQEREPFFEPRRERRTTSPEWWVNLTLAVLAVPGATAACSAALGVDTGTWWMRTGLLLAAVTLVLIGGGSGATALEKWGKR